TLNIISEDISSVRPEGINGGLVVENSSLTGADSNRQWRTVATTAADDNSRSLDTETKLSSGRWRKTATVGGGRRRMHRTEAKQNSALIPNEGKSNHDGLASVFEQIERVITASHQDKKFISIMIDDISFLEVAANGSSNDVLNLLHYCHTLTSEYGCAFIALDHKDIYLNGDRAPVILEMEYLADILVKAEPLATGLAKDVHGQLMVLDKETQHQHGISAIKTHNFHFKIKENGIECFYPGTKI
ncbi:Elongator complex protein 6, partial [Mucuna pruriens]